ncbi:hypothetical protein CEUSTIGMA_g826.t1 [Chlamydomonas eustigma]|uniref:Protein kinase domain-containing protein n=1 Tax=Chlamydomonas eustigma TaxID=1157962 RepID=A0A250WRD2_9CHLO|nr:hypothetical protein CEUSTIGMA_g826.t1 [Chlamydomonas eustigma]|eukprot:GAX73373.1 hypothetical protein CEUSTIGMA_g826.t1 [Chlamydomonas eustigma]
MAGNYLSLAKKGLSEAVKGATVVANKAADIAASIAEDGSTAILLSNARVLKDYKVVSLHHVATSGPGDVWKIYDATSRKAGFTRDVSVWILDKKALVDGSKGLAKPRSFDLLFEQQRKGCANMTRLKHPGVVKVVEPLEESGNQMVLVTERVLGSLRNIQTGFAAAPSAPQSSCTMQLSLLEVKLGLATVCDTLSFLHGGAGMAHCGLSPLVIMVAADGGWRLSGFTFSVTAAETFLSAPSASSQQQPSASTSSLFTYADPFPPPWEELAKPLLPYTAPELVSGWSADQSVNGSGAMQHVVVASPAADAFSLAVIAYEVLVCTLPSTPHGTQAAPLVAAGTAAALMSQQQGSSFQQLLPVRSSIHEYRLRVPVLESSVVLPGLPRAVSGILSPYLAVIPGRRPNLSTLITTSLFQGDLVLKGLRFLDTILQRDVAQKLAYLNDLTSLWSQMGPRLLQLKVLPALIQELHDGGEDIQAAALKVLVPMLKQMGGPDVALLVPELQVIKGQALELAVQLAEELASILPRDSIPSSLVPLLTRALDSNQSPRLQEASLKRLMPLISSSTLDDTSIKSSILPRLLSLCMGTTLAGVRANCILAMASVIPKVDRSEAEKVVSTLAQVTSVDRTAPTLVCAVQVVEAVSLRWGAEVSATQLLPVTCPWLISSSLNAMQFAGIMKVVQSMLERIKEKTEADRNALAAANRASAATASGSSSTSSSQLGPSWDTPLNGALQASSHAAARNPAQQQALQRWQQQQQQGVLAAGSVAASLVLPATAAAASGTSSNPASTSVSSSLVMTAPHWSSPSHLSTQDIGRPANASSQSSGSAAGTSAWGSGLPLQSEVHQPIKASAGNSWTTTPSAWGSGLPLQSEVHQPIKASAGNSWTTTPSAAAAASSSAGSWMNAPLHTPAPYAATKMHGANGTTDHTGGSLFVVGQAGGTLLSNRSGRELMPSVDTGSSGLFDGLAVETTGSTVSQQASIMATASPISTGAGATQAGVPAVSSHPGAGSSSRRHVGDGKVVGVGGMGSAAAFGNSAPDPFSFLTNLATSQTPSNRLPSVVQGSVSATSYSLGASTHSNPQINLPQSLGNCSIPPKSVTAGLSTSSPAALNLANDFSLI